MVSGVTLRPKVVASQVYQRTTDLRGGEAKQLRHGFRLDLGKGPVKTHQGNLQDIIGLLPSPQSWVAPEHFSGQTHEPFAGMLDQRISGVFVAGPEQVQASLKLGSIAFGHEDILPAEYRHLKPSGLYLEERRWSGIGDKIGTALSPKCPHIRCSA